MGCFSNGCFGSRKHNKISDKLEEEELHSNPVQQLLPSKLDRAKSEEDETATKVNDNDNDGSTNRDVLLQNETGKGGERDGALLRGKSEEDETMKAVKEEKGDSKKQETSDDDSKGGESTDDPEEESFDSLFSLCIDFACDREVSSPLKPISNHIGEQTPSECISHSMNRALVEMPSVTVDSNKENTPVEMSLVTVNSSKENACPNVIDNETAIIAYSLSSWLKSSSHDKKVGHSNSPDSEKNYSLPPVKPKASCMVLNEI